MIFRLHSGAALNTNHDNAIQTTSETPGTDTSGNIQTSETSRSSATDTRNMNNKRLRKAPTPRSSADARFAKKESKPSSSTNAPEDNTRDGPSLIEFRFQKPELRAVIGNAKGWSSVRSWLANSTRNSAALFMTGPNGCGKTYGVLSIASESGMEVCNVSADTETFQSILDAARCTPLGPGRIFLCDDVDIYQADWISEANRLLSKQKGTTQPIIFTANDAHSKSLQALRTRSLDVRMSALSVQEMSRLETGHADQQAVREAAEESKGDIRQFQFMLTVKSTRRDRRQRNPRDSLIALFRKRADDREVAQVKHLVFENYLLAARDESIDAVQASSERLATSSEFAARFMQEYMLEYEEFFIRNTASEWKAARDAQFRYFAGKRTASIHFKDIASL